MPNIKSAKKRVKISAMRAERNKAANSNLKTVIKKANAAVESKADTAAEQVRVAVKTIDHAASIGLIHKNCAARKKSAIVKKLNKA